MLLEARRWRKPEAGVGSSKTCELESPLPVVRHEEWLTLQAALWPRGQAHWNLGSRACREGLRGKSEKGRAAPVVSGTRSQFAQDTLPTVHPSSHATHAADWKRSVSAAQRGEILPQKELEPGGSVGN